MMLDFAKKISCYAFKMKNYMVKSCEWLFWWSWPYSQWERL